MEAAVDRLVPNPIGIDWLKPWYAPWRSLGEPIANAINRGATAWDALNAHRSAPVRFVPQQQLPAGMAYEQYIHASGNCPTREGLHDFFNALCWLRFPSTKARLNVLQAQQIAASGIQPVRGAARDALTLFDENAAIMEAPDALWKALAAKNWPELFGALRPVWAQTRVHLFGHALLEKLDMPRKPITAHVVRLPANTKDDQALDAAMGSQLSAAGLAGKQFAHLPLLGIPGWCEANRDPVFYDDREVFRRATPQQLGTQ